MAKFTNPLDYVKVAAPCPADWNAMTGSERARFCAQCQLKVYNLSAMTKIEAEKLLLESEGRLCVRFYRRKDGTILTRNCPTGLRALKRRVERVASATLSAVLTFCAGVGLYNAVPTQTAILVRSETIVPVELEPVLIEELPVEQSTVPESGEAQWVNGVATTSHDEQSGWVVGRKALPYERRPESLKRNRNKKAQ